MTEVVLELPSELRPQLKEPMGEIYTDADTLLGVTGDPLVAVGDMVTYHLVEAGRVPDLALIDGKTERSAVDDVVRDRMTGFDREERVVNPAATVTADLLVALQEAIDRVDDESTLLLVEGEEDLAVLPAVVVAHQGTSIVYGQPGEGMVHVAIDDEATDRARDILSQMDGDSRRLWTLLG